MKCEHYLDGEVMTVSGFVNDLYVEEIMLENVLISKNNACTANVKPPNPCPL